MTAASIRGLVLAALVFPVVAYFVFDTATLGQQPPAAKDPLQPTGPDDLATGFAGCRACHNEKLPIDPRDNPFAKKYKSNEFVLLSEGRTWNREDPHARSFEVLKGKLGQQMSRILRYDVTKAAQCLTCHAIDKSPGLPLPAEAVSAEERFETSEGITCNACHGLRKPWQQEHTVEKGGTIPWRTLSPEKKQDFGMRNLRDPVVKAQFCTTCHVGSAADHRVVTHEMYAAGHPPLPPFELGTFMDCQPKHWGYPTNPELKFFTPEGFTKFAGEKFRDTHPNWTWELYRFQPADKELYMARQIVAGAVGCLQAEMRLLADDAEQSLANKPTGGDFARFDCFACHHDLVVPSARQARGYAGPPGRPALKAWTAALPGIVIEHAAGIERFADLAAGFPAKWDAVQKAALSRPFGEPKALALAAREMADWCQEFLNRVADDPSPVYSAKEAERLIGLIGNAATSDRWIADPEAAMHLTWAYLTLRKAIGRPAAEAGIETLGKTIPTRVRYEPYSTPDGDPKSVGEMVEQRMKVFREYDPKTFREAFLGLGTPKK